MYDLEQAEASYLVARVLGVSEEKARGILASLGGVPGLARAGSGALAETVGTRGERLACALELAHRTHRARAEITGVRMPDAEAVARWAYGHLCKLDHEELWTLCLDGRHNVRTYRMVASGGIHGLHIGMRDVLRVALQAGASAFILVHNHPSGDPTPSDEDVAFTRAMSEAARVVGVPLLDHVVVSRAASGAERAAFKSMLDMGLFR